jgi:Fe2+ transport system protein FeoA
LRYTPLVTSVPLTHAPLRSECYVTDVAGDGAFLERLRELGIEVGAQVRVLRPGRSLLLGVGECRLALRATEASAVSVCVSAASTA